MREKMSARKDVQKEMRMLKLTLCQPAATVGGIDPVRALALSKYKHKKVQTECQHIVITSNANPDQQQQRWRHHYHMQAAQSTHLT